MHRSFAPCACAVLALAGTGLARAAIIDAAITADNHYALYTTTNVGLELVGQNEAGASGSPGTYNWSIPEPYSFFALNEVYIAAWSDDAVAQGVLAQVFVDSGESLHSGDSKWEVYATHVNRGDGDPVPTLSEMSGHIADATTGGLWETPFAGGNNGIAPWGSIPGITSAARWMWWNTPGDSDPIHGGSGAGEFLIFRIAVPTPGSAALLGAGALLAFRRKR